MTELVFILDRSGSMINAIEDTVGGFNTMIGRLKQENVAGLVTVVLFNQRPASLYSRVPLEEIRPMTREDFRPMGRTALLDAIGMSIRSISACHHAAPAECCPEATQFIIFTDGKENASRLYNYQKVSQMIDEQRSGYGWEFLFMGADFEDVEQEAQRLHISREQAMRFRKADHGIRTMYCVAADAVHRSQDRPGR